MIVMALIMIGRKFVVYVLCAVCLYVLMCVTVCVVCYSYIK